MVILMVNDFKLDPWAWLRMSMVLIVLPHTFLILCSLSVGLVALMVWRRGPSFVPP